MDGKGSAADADADSAVKPISPAEKYSAASEKPNAASRIALMAPNWFKSGIANSAPQPAPTRSLMYKIRLAAACSLNSKEMTKPKQHRGARADEKQDLHFDRAAVDGEEKQQNGTESRGRAAKRKANPPRHFGTQRRGRRADADA